MIRFAAPENLPHLSLVRAGSLEDISHSLTHSVFQLFQLPHPGVISLTADAAEVEAFPRLRSLLVVVFIHPLNPEKKK